MRVGIYARVSTLEQKNEGYSIGEQEERLRSYCVAKGWEVHRAYIDGGYSGANMDRPGLRRMLEDAQDGRIHAILVYKLDRLSRSQRDTLEIIEDILIPSKVEFISITENLDTSTPFGRIIISILAAFAALERSQIRERMDVGREGRAKDGYWHGSSNPPVGYRYVDGLLEVDEYEAMQIRELFRLFNMRIAPMRLQKMMNDKGYRTKYGQWKRRGLKPIITNRVYVGEVSFKGEWYTGRHEAIVDRDVFDKAQKILKEHLGDHRRKPRYDSPIGGLVKCGWCGNNYFIRGGPALKSGESSRAFTCYKRTCYHGEWAKIPKDERCKNTNVRVEALEITVLNEVKRLSLEPEAFRERPNENLKEIAAIEKRLDEINIKLDRYLELFEVGAFDTEKIKEKVSPLNEEKSKLTREVDKLKNVGRLDKSEAVEIALTIGDVMDIGNLDEARALCHELIDAIVIDGDKVEIHWKF